jgi:hypothetical protein
MKQALFVMTTMWVALAAAGCSSFEREWRAAVRNRPGSGTTIAGPGKGSWRSDPTGHHGELRCVVGRAAEGVQRGIGRDVPFHYHAKWGKVLGGSFKTVQPVREEKPGRFHSEGDWTLPRWAGGKYHYRIVATPQEMRATYRSSSDHGKLHLVRPPASAAAARQ